MVTEIVKNLPSQNKVNKVVITTKTIVLITTNIPVEIYHTANQNRFVIDQILANHALIYLKN